MYPKIWKLHTNHRYINQSDLKPLNEPENRTCISYTELKGAAVLSQPVCFGASSWGDGGHCSGWSLSWNLDCGPQQINLFPMHILHVVLNKVKKQKEHDNSKWSTPYTRTVNSGT